MEEDCLHCAINRLMDERNERLHIETGEPVNINDNVDDLIACAAELIAMYSDAKTRKFVAKRTAKLLIDRVAVFRAQGRFPGGPGQPGGEPLH